jgi:hypothetical protein
VGFRRSILGPKAVTDAAKKAGRMIAGLWRSILGRS